MGADGTSKDERPQETDGRLALSLQPEGSTGTETQNMTRKLIDKERPPYASGLCISSNGDGSVGAARAASTS